MTRTIAAVAVVAALGAALSAVEPHTWNHATEADFAAGTCDGAAPNNLGEVALTRALTTLLAPQEDLGMLTAVAVADPPAVYVAAAPSGKVYRLADGKAVEFATLPGVLVKGLHFEGKDLLAGVSGEAAGLYRIDAAGKVTAIWTDKQVASVWALVPRPAGGWFVATGPEGRIYQVSPQGQGAIVYDSTEKNITALAAGPDGTLLAGTGEDGLIVQVDPAAKTGRVLYDAEETEISVLRVGPDGAIYAATADPDKAEGAADAAEVEPGHPHPGSTSGPDDDSPADDEAVEPDTDADAGAPRPADGNGPTGAAPRPPAPEGPRKARGPTAAPADDEDAEGNAVYRIDAKGFVQPVFRRPVLLRDLLVRGRTLVLATGGAGEIYTVDLDKDRLSVMAKVDPTEVTALAEAGTAVIAVTADRAAAYEVASQYARKGTCLSAELDAGQVARWGTAFVRAQAPAGTVATFATRSGNVATADDATWSAWSKEQPAQGYLAVPSPAGRFLQYRLTLTGDGSDTPVVEQVQLVYQVDNLPPAVKALEATPAASDDAKDADTAPQCIRTLSVRAVDPNEDALAYSFFFKRSDHQRWILLAEDVGEDSYAWDTRGVADGRYDVMVEATDRPANPPAAAHKAARVVRGVAVDNTPPVVADLAAAPADKPAGTLVLTGTATDANRIRALAYAVDSNDAWEVILPADGIADGPRETFKVSLEGLKPGTHRIAVRAADEFLNTGYGSIEVEVK